MLLFAIFATCCNVPKYRASQQLCSPPFSFFTVFLRLKFHKEQVFGMDNLPVRIFPETKLCRNFLHRIQAELHFRKHILQVSSRLGSKFSGCIQLNQVYLKHEKKLKTKHSHFSMFRVGLKLLFVCKKLQKGSKFFQKPSQFLLLN